MHTVARSIFYGIAASVILFVIYFSVLTLISGWAFAQSQFSGFWYFIVTLALGFGIQVGLYGYLRNVINHRNGAGVVVVSGATSTIAMISCCAHYLANLLPILGVAGAVTFAAQYQIELFWVGLATNVAGIAYIADRIIKFSKQ